MATQQIMDADQLGEVPADGATPAKGGRKKLIIIAAAVLLLLCAVGAVFATGLVGKLMGGSAAKAKAAEIATPGAVDLPEIIANLNAGAKRTAFVRIKARLELASKADEPAVIAAQPKMQDLFQTYLRDMRPDELRTSAGTYRLREELLSRANIALTPARVTEILFVELLVQ